MAFPEGFITELKARTDLIELIGRYSTLRRAGSNMVCCCPFHSEKTPSFTVFSTNDHYYCFGCGSGGDAITFLMRAENLDYLSAVEQLCNRCGMTMPENEKRPGEKTVDKKRLYELNALAARFFHKKLVSPEGKPARDYLVGRGFDLKNVTRFGLGYASDSWDELSSYLVKEGYTVSELKEMFLASISPKSGSLYDYFRNRLIFPVIDVSGRVIAFSGRYIGPPDERAQKYFNTSDTPVFKKSKNLYGLNVAKNTKESSLILCEGNMDVLSLQAAGFENSVAGLGTALTSEQVRLIKRYTDTVYLCYDSDQAGRNAAQKAMRLISEAGMTVKVITLSGAKDPDEFLQKYGKLKFAEVLKNASGQIEYRFDQLKAGYDLETLDGKKGFIKEVVGVLARWGTPLETDLFLNKLSELTSVSRQVLNAELSSTRKSISKQAEKARVKEDMEKAAGYKNTLNPDKIKFSASASKEENILGILLLRSDYLLDPKIRPLLNEDIFLCAVNKKAINLLLELTKDKDTADLGDLGEFLSPDEMSLMTGYRVRRSMLSDNSPEVLKELLENLADASKKTLKKDTEQPLDQWLADMKKKKGKKQ
ncbi:MAG: DNA primase [Ruminococcaceae bacterium]|nr:DNA primase [Oscillospiraceae bacterium]